MNRIPTTPPPSPEHLGASLDHVDHALKQGQIARGAAKGLIYSLIETLGVVLGDPSLPEQLRDGYEGLLETAREIEQRLHDH